MISETIFDQSIILELAGVAGFGLYVSNYMMLTFRVLTGNCLIYYIINISAASLVLAGLMNSFDLASAMIQMFWICISTVGILMRLSHGQLRSR